MLALAALALTFAASPAHAAEWGTIIAGVSTMDAVRAQYGGPSKADTQKVDNYDTSSWVYEGAQAPGGLIRMVVDFGILQAAGYRRDVVRSFRLEPKPGVFTRGTVMAGWGRPDRAGRQGDEDVFVYAQGLVVIFGRDGAAARTLVFTPPQTLEPAKPSR
jgi:hypothetical protein